MRASGILLHISSLPSDGGIGTLGKAAYDFVDFLKRAKQTYWQILPIGPTSYGDSPYQSYSSHAGNPYFVDFDLLADEKLLNKSEYKTSGKYEPYADYSKLYETRFKILKKAFLRFKNTDMTAFNEFLAKNERWISNYGLFMAIKEAEGGKPWYLWDEGLKKRDPHSLWLFKSSHEDEVMFWEFVQFKFFEQFSKLKKYANENGIKIIGDIPIYVSPDSADVWVYPDLFDLDDELVPNSVAGCPPDGYSPDGQLWGNPLYNWARHKETGYNWWLDRLNTSFEFFDVMRIDHFRGFDEFYAIPYGDKTAVNGCWKKGPGIEFFDFVKSKLKDLPIIAEDLGFLTPSVLKMLEKSGFPGMKVLEFAFDSTPDNIYLPHNHSKNCAVYIGTHDNDTLMGWAESADRKTLEFCLKYLRIPKDGDFNREVIKSAFASSGDTVIIQMQDYLRLGSEARMNTPSTAVGNWRWRAPKKAFTKKLAAEIADITETYGRSPANGAAANCTDRIKR